MTTATDFSALASGRAALARGDIKGALKQFMAGLAAAPHEPAYAQACVETLNFLDQYRLPGDVIAALERHAFHAPIDPMPLPRIARNVLAADPRFATVENDLGQTTGDWFFASPLLIAGLERATVTDETLENKLTAARRHAMMMAAREGLGIVTGRHARFMIALARHGIATRHVWLERSDERAALMRVLSATAPGPARAVLHCLYAPLDDLAEGDKATLPPLLAQIAAYRAEEKTIAAALPALTAVDPGLSAKVQAQYETFPYPLWTDVAANAPLTWPAMIAQFITAPAAPVPATDAPQVLIAGCGTGRSTCMMATLLPSADILAVDLSRASLAYAVRQARRRKLANVTFAVADILRLGEIDRRFDLIECGGVLHHMAEPDRGLAVLSNLLNPGGVMSVALYSERARAPIVAARAFIAERGITGDLAGLRQVRHEIHALPADHPLRRLTRRPDFYAGDSLHDLIFNVQEVRYTPAGLKRLIATTDLVFLGFNTVKPGRLAEYRAAYPADPLGRNLDTWEAFDHTHPDTFQGMFQMWLQKPRLP
ncbi:MAG: class I SAM-dependent methyltransferase [Rhodospirillaceae bacterium]|nr:class I SAM-dependent methyltransferase [Rhodospirillaceae bacterium]